MLTGKPRVKVCGITRIEDALFATELGAHAIGLVFAESPRRISPEKAADIVRHLPPFVSAIGVFVNEEADRVRQIVEQCGLSAVQLHGDETPDYARGLPEVKIIKAVRVKDRSSFDGVDRYQVSAFLLDTYSKKARGGTGETFNWELAKEAELPAPFILSGGLNPENMGEAIRAVRPYAVDVSSGVESEPGKKDAELLRKLFEEVEDA